mmetsp:Transcript_34467/g.114128  ORF Transcript_34467/g.114128 Transcript_34467/m.114128 type:complete len:303 (+) Transcript_34467:62-970(+)
MHTRACSCRRCLACAAGGCDRHMSAEDALAAAQAEGLDLVRSTKNASSFVGVCFRDNSHVHPFYAADYSTASNGRTARKILGFFATAEQAALEKARHARRIRKRVGSGRANFARSHPPNGKRPAETSTAQAGAASPIPAWWTYSSIERTAIEAMSKSQVEQAAADEGLVLEANRIDPSRYKGVIERKGAGGAVVYSAYWQPCASDARRLGFTGCGMRFGFWTRPEHAALALARERKRAFERALPAVAEPHAPDPLACAAPHRRMPQSPASAAPGRDPQSPLRSPLRELSQLADDRLATRQEA